MKPFSKLPAAMAAALALNACGPDRPAEAPVVITSVRADAAEALSQMGTNREGIQSGPNPNMIYSVVCGEGFLEEKTRDDVNMAAARQLIKYACPDDPAVDIPFQPAGSGRYGQMFCEGVMAPRTIICKGKKKTLPEPQ